MPQLVASKDEDANIVFRALVTPEEYERETRRRVAKVILRKPRSGWSQEDVLALLEAVAKELFR